MREMERFVLDGASIRSMDPAIDPSIDRAIDPAKEGNVSAHLQVNCIRLTYGGGIEIK